MRIKNDKKGVMGLNTAKSFVVALLALAVLGITFLIVMNSLGDTPTISYDDVDVNNETGAFINSTGYEFQNQGVNTITVNEARNASDGSVIASGNYTVNNSADPIQLFNATSQTYPDVNLDYTYQVNSDSQQVISNVSEANASFFENAGTWFSLLAVVIIILIISAVIFVVNRFGGGSQQGTNL